ncbi:uncharacterized protein LOC142618986 [Castanea sativa]|uniref:uncharacterized protein LOC142618986 n=1 Tax=Castanea sativa TaxID=21020 RepID=UPI003F650F24
MKKWILRVPHEKLSCEIATCRARLEGEESCQRGGFCECLTDLGKMHFRNSYEKLHLILFLVTALCFLVWLLCRDLHSHFLTEDQVLSTSWLARSIIIEDGIESRLTWNADRPHFVSVHLVKRVR